MAALYCLDLNKDSEELGSEQEVGCWVEEKVARELAAGKVEVVQAELVIELEPVVA